MPARTRSPAVDVRFLFSADGTYSRLFHYCLDREPGTQLAVAYFRGPDIAQHRAFVYMPTSASPGATDVERRAFARVVPETYKFADELLARIVDRMGPQDSLLVLSDHGYAALPGEGLGVYGHGKGEPPGVLFAMGPEFRRGAPVRDADIYDLFPTAMRVMGFPPALDSEGRCLEELLRPEWTAQHPPLEPIPTYGRRLQRHDTIRASRETDKTLTDHLRALGYLD